MGKEYNETSQAVQAHLSIIQSVIQRMASNSAASKTYCITLVSAVLVIVADKGKPDYALLAVIPILLFLVLDAYYLALEKAFRNSYNAFIKKLHESTITMSDLFVVTPEGNFIKLFIKSFFSFSICAFYLSLLLLVWVAKTVLL